MCIRYKGTDLLTARVVAPAVLAPASALFQSAAMLSQLKGLRHRDDKWWKLQGLNLRTLSGVTP